MLSRSCGYFSQWKYFHPVAKGRNCFYSLSWNLGPSDSFLMVYENIKLTQILHTHTRAHTHTHAHTHTQPYHEKQVILKLSRAVTKIGRAHV